MAPSSHNTQPWRFKIESQQISTRAVPEGHARGGRALSLLDAGRPSRTALAAAAHRAAHQVLERGAIFSDPLALRILGADAEEAIRRVSADPSSRKLRLFIAVRTRFAEDALAAAIARGVRQVVVLGAGLDTYAYRSTANEGTRIFEADHPATQAWKRKRLADAAIAPPPALTLAAVDFEHDTLGTALEHAGFDPDQPAFFMCLGVVPYLTEESVMATLRYVANRSGGAEVVFDYCNPRSRTTQGSSASDHEALAARVASVGESFKCCFETERLLGALASLSFSEVEDLGPEQIRARYFANRGGSSGNNGGHVVRAASNRA
ncbi:MAG: class I SAM-dependent methyltransferase [Steroidobacteraceae bacterium]